MHVRQLSLGLDVAASRRDPARNAYIAKALMEDSSGEAKLMESICERENRHRALRRVEANDGAPGVDGMTCRQLRGFVKRTWQASKQALDDGTYRPLPVRGKEIPKPDGGGMRKLGIPAVMDRLVQQATVQPLVAIYNHTFSDSSFGYRPGRSQAQAVERYRQHVESRPVKILRSRESSSAVKPIGAAHQGPTGTEVDPGIPEKRHTARRSR